MFQANMATLQIDKKLYIYNIYIIYILYIYYIYIYYIYIYISRKSNRSKLPKMEESFTFVVGNKHLVGYSPSGGTAQPRCHLYQHNYSK